VTGIDAELLGPDYDSYAAKTIATSLSDDKVALTIYAENFYEVWLDITATSAAEGLVVTATGQYYEVWWQSIIEGQFLPVGDSFDVMGYHVVDKTQMMWDVPSTTTIGGCMVITFVFNTELVTVPGDYTVDLLFQMGFV